MNPRAAYQREIERGHRQDDPAQRALLPVLDRIHAQIIDRADDGVLVGIVRVGARGAAQEHPARDSAHRRSSTKG